MEFFDAAADLDHSLEMVVPGFGARLSLRVRGRSVSRAVGVELEC